MPQADTMLGEPKTLKKSAFARLVGVSPGRVSQMITNGLPVEPDGKIDVARGKLWISGNVSPTRSAAQSDQSDLPFAADRNAAQERQRLLREQADGQALKNAQARRELVSADEIERTWNGVIRRTRSSLLAIPGRLRIALPHLSPADIKVVDGEIRRVLSEMADAH